MRTFSLWQTPRRGHYNDREGKVTQVYRKKFRAPSQPAELIGAVNDQTKLFSFWALSASRKDSGKVLSSSKAVVVLSTGIKLWQPSSSSSPHHHRSRRISSSQCGCCSSRILSRGQMNCSRQPKPFSLKWLRREQATGFFQMPGSSLGSCRTYSGNERRRQARQ